MQYDVNTAVILLLGSFAILLALRVPVAFCLGISSVVTAYYCGIRLPALAQKMVVGVNQFSLLAIPFFILCGEIMNEGGMSIRLIRLADAIIGRVRGNLALVNVLSSTFFGGISGSAVADTSSNGAIMIPMMVKSGYSPAFSGAVTITTSIQGILIPPSHNMIIYSLVAGGVSVSSLFMAGLVPGLGLGLSLAITCYYISVKRNYPIGEKTTWAQKFQAFWDSALGLFTFVIVVVGVITGLYTATEAAGVAALYAFIITFLVYRDVPFSKLPVILKRTLNTLAIVIALISCSAMFGFMLAFLKVPAMATNALLTLSDNKYVILLVVNLLLLALGCIMDMAPLILICTPILLPVIDSIGVDRVHFGIIMMLNLGIGLLTPPVGSTLFVGCAIAKVSMEKMVRETVPFYIAMFIMLMIITYIPEVVMTLPRIMLGYQ